MMKKFFALMLGMALVFSLCACGAAPAQEPAPAVGMPNPLTEVSADELGQATGLYLNAPEGASDVAYFTLEDGERGTVAQVCFTYSGSKCTYRAVPSGEAAGDFSGIYFDGTEHSVSVSYCEAVLLTGEYTVVYWFDIVPGVSYCLGVEAPLTEADALSLAESCFVPTQGDA